VLVIWGHGRSGRVPGDSFDEHKVVRFRDNIPKIGRTDIVCSLYERDRRNNKEFWHLGEWRKHCTEILKPFNPRIPKPSSGLSAVIIAREKGYEDIGVIGFDFTLHPERIKRPKWWSHDAYAECECIKTLGVIDLG
jgi:hypothetical protein